MNYEITCFNCEKKFLVGIENTRIIGPHIEVTCPFCKDFVDKNFSKFIDEQIDKRINLDERKPSGYRVRKAVAMQKFFKAVEELIIDAADARSRHNK